MDDKAFKFYHARAVEPLGRHGLGAELFLDGEKVKGLVSYRYENSAGHLKKLTIELYVEEMVIEIKKTGA